MNKYLNIGLWVLIVVACFFLLGFVGSKQSQMLCNDIEIRIDRSNGNFFLEKEDIYAMVYHEADSVLGSSLEGITTEALEHKLNNHPSVSNTEVFKTIDGKLVIEVEQRTPIVRVFTQRGNSYYIDSTGRFMPTSKKYTARVMIANGFITDEFVRMSNLNAHQIPDSLKSHSMIDEIFNLAEYIRKDEFWKAQIEQLYVNKDSEIELIPRVGNHRIVFGDDVDIHKKFNKLKIFYHKGLSKTGWNEYSIINLKYANQVVCTKRY
tara:strand:- start:60 stop:851 length:792 start_codon:yes stop_codon:yes gene_type:complete